MKTFKKVLRLMALTLIIVLASVIPVPITFHRKDDLPKFKIEQVDKEKKDEDNQDIKVIFYA